MLCCAPVSSSSSSKESITQVEAVELVFTRMRDVGVQIGNTESQMLAEERQVKMAASDKDMEKARLHMRRLRELRGRRTRFLQVREKLWAMKEMLNEQSQYVSIQDTFTQGMQITEELLQKVSLEKVEDLMDRMDEAAHETREISHELTSERGFLLGDSLTEEDDDWVERELEHLLSGVRKEPELPTTPTRIPSTLKEEEEVSREREEEEDASAQHKVALREGERRLAS